MCGTQYICLKCGFQQENNLKRVSVMVVRADTKRQCNRFSNIEIKRSAFEKKNKPKNYFTNKERQSRAGV